MESFEHLVKCPAIAPITKTLLNRRPRAKALRHIAPGSARTEHPEDAVEHHAIICSWAPTAAGFIEDVCKQIPGGVGEFVSFGHRGLLPLMVAYFTETRRLRNSNWFRLISYRAYDWSSFHDHKSYNWTTEPIYTWTLNATFTHH